MPNAPVFRSAPFRVVSSRASTANVVVGFDDADSEAEFARLEAAALRAGHTIRYNDGRSRWRETTAIFDPAAGDGSAGYTWHDDGNRVRHLVEDVTLHPGGRVERRVLRQVWRVLD